MGPLRSYFTRRVRKRPIKPIAPQGPWNALIASCTLCRLARLEFRAQLEFRRDSSLGGRSLFVAARSPPLNPFVSGRLYPSMAAVSPPPTALNFTEAIKDSPRFRQLLGEHEVYLGKIDKRISEVVRLVNLMNDYGKNYASTFYNISVAVNQLCTEAFANDPLAENIFKQISDAYAQTVHLHKVYVEQANATLSANLTAYLKNELTKVNDAKSHFENLSSTLDENLAKKATISRHKTAELLDAKNSLTAVGTCFAHTALDYVAQITVAHAHKNYVILEALWAFVKESSSFFSRGHAFFDEWTSIENGSIADTIDVLRSKSTVIERKMQDRHAVVPKEVFQHPGGMPSDPDVVMEGYLFKRASNAFRSWNRRWFQIKDNKLLYCHRCLDEETPTVMEADLKLCLVRPAPQNIERACCFELVTPTKSHLLQADSDALMFAWMRALQRTIQHLHESDEQIAKPRSASVNNTDSGSDCGASNSNLPADALSTSPSSTADSGVVPSRSFLEELRQVPGNDCCADCLTPDAKWVSLNLGVVLCIECCGIHRSLGVQVSKVRSLTMDSIDGEQKNVLLGLGNEAVNAIYLQYLPLTDVVPPVPKPNATRPIREAWIRAKYLEKRFSRPDTLRALSSAQTRSEHLTQKPKVPSLSVTSQSPHRSQSWYNLTEEQSFNAEAESDDSPRSTTSSEVKWRSSPSLCGKTGPKSKLIRRPIEISRLSSCGSDTNLGETDERTGGFGGKELVEAAKRGDLKAVLRLIANGVDINMSYKGTSALHAAVDQAQTVMMEFLILNSAKINSVDSQLDSPLHIAARKGHTLAVCQLMKRGADKHLKNHHGKIPLDLAVDGKYADIVTLLRIHDMRDEFNEEFNNPMDETVDDVILDIKSRAAKA
uniref:PH domain-containing protein n=1 Tax=Steinernema glaseri TaxID=37863 RepID=A0A1I7YMH4_9BILA